VEDEANWIMEEVDEVKRNQKFATSCCGMTSSSLTWKADALVRKKWRKILRNEHVRLENTAVKCVCVHACVMAERRRTIYTKHIIVCPSLTSSLLLLSVLQRLAPVYLLCTWPCRWRLDWALWRRPVTVWNWLNVLSSGHRRLHCVPRTAGSVHHHKHTDTVQWSCWEQATSIITYFIISQKASDAIQHCLNKSLSSVLYVTRKIQLRWHELMTSVAYTTRHTLQTFKYAVHFADIQPTQSVGLHTVARLLIFHSADG